MTGIDAIATLRALEESYGAVTAAVRTLPETAFERPTRCDGWTVRDLLYHMLLDPQRALVAVATPTSEAATTDLVAYWRLFQPGTEQALRHADFVRRAASAYASGRRRWSGSGRRLRRPPSARRQRSSPAGRSRSRWRGRPGAAVGRSPHRHPEECAPRAWSSPCLTSSPR